MILTQSCAKLTQWWWNDYKNMVLQTVLALKDMVKSHAKTKIKTGFEVNTVFLKYYTLQEFKNN